MRRRAPMSANLLQFLGANVDPLLFFGSAVHNLPVFCINGFIYSVLKNCQPCIIRGLPVPARKKWLFRGD